MNCLNLSEFIGHNRLISKKGTESTLFIKNITQDFDSLPVVDAFFCQTQTPTICQIDRVIFNNPATVVFWKDGTKTVVKCQPGDVYDQEKGLALCIAKKYLGNKSNFNNVFKKYLIDESQLKFRIIETRGGCSGAIGHIGHRTTKEHNHGLLSTDSGYNVELENGDIWRINHDAKIEYLD